MDENREFCMSIDQIGSKMLLELEKNMGLACLVVERTAKQNCQGHVDMGHLQASITHKINVTPSFITGSVFSPLDYAPYEEKGTGIYAKDGNGRKTPWKYNVKAGKYKGWHTTSGQKPHPFLEPARDKSKDKVINILGGKK